MMSLMHATLTLVTAIYGMPCVKSHTNKVIKNSKNNIYVKKYLVVKQINLECLLPTKLGINHDEYLGRLHSRTACIYKRSQSLFCFCGWNPIFDWQLSSYKQIHNFSAR